MDGWIGEVKCECEWLGGVRRKGGKGVGRMVRGKGGRGVLHGGCLGWDGMSCLLFYSSLLFFSSIKSSTKVCTGTRSIN